MCVPTRPRTLSFRRELTACPSPADKYLIHELWAESAKLYELAEQDEAVAHAHGGSRSKKSKRAKGNISDVPGADSLAKYVKEKEEWVEKEQAVRPRSPRRRRLRVPLARATLTRRRTRTGVQVALRRDPGRAPCSSADAQR